MSATRLPFAVRFATRPLTRPPGSGTAFPMAPVPQRP